MAEYLNNPIIVIDFLSFILLSSFVLSILRNRRSAPEYTVPFLWMLIFSLLQTVFDILSSHAYSEQLRALLHFSSAGSYVFSYAISLSFCFFLYRLCREIKGENPIWQRLLAFAAAGYLANGIAVVLLTRWGNLFPMPGEAETMSRIPRALILYGFMLTVLVTNFVVIVTQQMSTRKTVILCLYCIIPLISAPMIVMGVRRTQIFVLVQDVIIYCHIFAMQGRDLAETEAQLLTSRMETMLSQIQPHFLYNALNSCVSLCDDDPQLAKQTLLNFSRYLRANLDSLGKKEPIPFLRELEHTRTYLDIEQIRFGERVKVEYDLQETDFMLPALSLQPLAENAVKHGITMKRGGGTLKISTRADEENYYVIVEDDGVGFEKLPEEPEHIGIRNIHGRLASMVGGNLTYESTPNIGTKATITLPKKGHRT